MQLYELPFGLPLVLPGMAGYAYRGAFTLTAPPPSSARMYDVVSSCMRSVTLSRFFVILSMISDPLIIYSLRLYLLRKPLHTYAILGPVSIILYNKIRNNRPSSLSRYIYLISGVVARGFVCFAPGAGVPLCLRMFA